MRRSRKAATSAVSSTVGTPTIDEIGARLHAAKTRSENPGVLSVRRSTLMSMSACAAAWTSGWW